MKVAIIGGGAAGMFGAIQVKSKHPKAQVCVFEKSKALLSKLKISGGGRCNVTNGASTTSDLCKAYPRGAKRLKKLFPLFSNHDMIEWLHEHGVETVLQDDGCVFPKAQDSQVIIDCFISEAHRLGVEVKLNTKVISIEPNEYALELVLEDSKMLFDKVIVTTGGSPKLQGLDWLSDLGHKIESPVPSLFTFNLPGDAIRSLMGLVVENAKVSLQGTKFKAEGPLLITHWGMSGPAILILSSFAARFLSEQNYEAKLQVNWVNETNTEKIQEELFKIMAEHPKKILSNYRPYKLPERLWLFVLEKVGIDSKKKWEEIGKKQLNKLTEVLTNDIFSIQGKTTFRDEFVTCGGVSLSDIDIKTMESKVVKNLYFAGEVLDIDAITGGYNFQAAWTTAYIAANLANSSK